MPPVSQNDGANGDAGEEDLPDEVLETVRAEAALVDIPLIGRDLWIPSDPETARFRDAKGSRAIGDKRPVIIAADTCELKHKPKESIASVAVLALLGGALVDVSSDLPRPDPERLVAFRKIVAENYHFRENGDLDWQLIPLLALPGRESFEPCRCASCSDPVEANKGDGKFGFVRCQPCLEAATVVCGEENKKIRKRIREKRGKPDRRPPVPSRTGMEPNTSPPRRRRGSIEGEPSSPPSSSRPSSLNPPGGGRGREKGRPWAAEQGGKPMNNSAIGWTDHSFQSVVGLREGIARLQALLRRGVQQARRERIWGRARR